MDKNIVTYSRSVSVTLSDICFNNCKYCDFPKNVLDQSRIELAVPYSMIKVCNDVKKKGAKEFSFVSGERPDKFAAVRSRLDLWGFSSFIEYVYTICELVFLEGLLPTINIGSFTKDEMSIIRRVAVSATVMLDTVDEKISGKYNPKKMLTERIDTIKFAGEGKLPITTGILVGLGESQKSRKDAMELIRDLHLQYGHIQNVVLQNFIPKKGTILEKESGPTKDEMLEAAEMARKILPEDVQITIPAVANKDIMQFIDLGIRDIGNFDIAEEKKAADTNTFLTELEKKLKKKDLGLQRRLPIFSKYIAENWYSRKLAQILDKYKVLLNAAEAKNAETDDDDGIELDEKPKKKSKKSK